MMIGLCVFLMFTRHIRPMGCFVDVGSYDLNGTSERRTYAKPFLFLAWKGREGKGMEGKGREGKIPSKHSASQS